MQHLVISCLLLATLAAAPSPVASLISSDDAGGTAGRSLLQYGAAVPIDVSVVLLFQSDVENGLRSPCVLMVDRAAKYASRAINFFVTGYYTDSTGDGKADAIGYRQSLTDSAFKPYNKAAADKFSAGLAICMRHAVDKGFNLVTHIHLDDGSDKGSWRNSVIFNPLQKYGQMSYYEALLQPVARAVAAANYKKAIVYFALQAEMGATIFYHAKQYKDTMSGLRTIMTSTGTAPANIRIGVNVNWEKICGCPANLMYSVNYYNDFQAVKAQIQKQISTSDVQALFKAINWIGISAYAGLPENLNINDLERSIKRVDGELAFWGMSLSGLGKEIIMSEYGLGGGQTGDYKTPAAGPYQVASAPFWGVDRPYDKKKDPWASDANRNWMRNFYSTTIQWAGRGGGPSYQIRGIFLWNLISYDVLAIHPWSTTSSGTYLDTTVASAITNHNKGLRGKGK